MKVLDMARKDLLRALRNAFFLVFGLGIPLLVTGLFYFAFGGLVVDDGGFDLPATQVQVVNLDQPNPQYGGFSAGQILLDFLKREELSDLLQVVEAGDEASARAAVDNQEAAVAVIIPSDFTAAAVEPMGHATVELYQDPTLTLGPRIVKGIISQFVDGFAGSKIAADVAYDQLTERGVAVDASTVQRVAIEYGSWVATLAESQQAGTNVLLDVQSPAPVEEEGGAGVVRVISLIMAGMMVFYVFFSGAASAQSILQEEEAGTLPRLFTTPTPRLAILGAKFLSSFVTLIIQVVVLVVVSALIFGIDWGEPVPIALVALGLVVLAASFGLFVTSLLKNTRQTGIVYGGVLTVLGMVGLAGVFTASAPGASKVTDMVSLFVPHGWGVRGWQILLEGGGVSDVLTTVLVMLALGVVFFVLGALRLRKRFA